MTRIARRTSTARLRLHGTRSGCASPDIAHLGPMIPGCGQGPSPGSTLSLLRTEHEPPPALCHSGWFHQRPELRPHRPHLQIPPAGPNQAPGPSQHHLQPNQRQLQAAGPNHQQSPTHLQAVGQTLVVASECPKLAASTRARAHRQSHLPSLSPCPGRSRLSRGRTSLSQGRTSLSRGRTNLSRGRRDGSKITKAPPPGYGPIPAPPEEPPADTPGPSTVPWPYLMFRCNRQLILCFSSCAVLLAGAQSRRGCHAQSTGPIRPLVLPFIQVFRV